MLNKIIYLFINFFAEKIQASGTQPSSWPSTSSMLDWMGWFLPQVPELLLWTGLLPQGHVAAKEIHTHKH